MDWAKAKTILIVVLLAVCLVLTGMLVVRDVKAVNQLNENKEAALLYLEDRGVKVFADVPTKRIKLPVLFVEYNSANETAMTYEKYEVLTNSESSKGYVLSSAGERSAEVMPASSALLEAAVMFGPDELEINRINLCYYIDDSAPISNGSQDTAFPAWFVETNKGTCFVLAY
ncbi:MAG: hypothetical protein Q4E99_06505 [Bacillota bacterium]|nr:hypothetical protein [Bacillota bacterium]